MYPHNFRYNGFILKNFKKIFKYFYNFTSIGFKEQVEYTSLPPSFNKLTALFTICNCNLCKEKESFGDQVFHLCGNFLITASLEQGTSHKILSNKILKKFYC